MPISSSGRASPSVDPTCLLTAQRAGWGTRRYGLIQEMNGRVMSAFSKEDNAEAKSVLKFSVHRAPGVTAALKTACDGLLTDYWGDFLHIITQEHQVRPTSCALNPHVEPATVSLVWLVTLATRLTRKPS